MEKLFETVYKQSKENDARMKMRTLIGKIGSEINNGNFNRAHDLIIEGTYRVEDEDFDVPEDRKKSIQKLLWDCTSITNAGLIIDKCLHNLNTISEKIGYKELD